MRKLLKSDYLDYLGRQPRGLPLKPTTSGLEQETVDLIQRSWV